MTNQQFMSFGDVDNTEENVSPTTYDADLLHFIQKPPMLSHKGRDH